LSVTQPRVVIVGGGFGGLFATRELAGAPVSVTLIDKRNYHLFRPMLYQVATGLLSADQIAGPLRSILNRQQNVEVLLDEVSGIDTEKRLVHLKQHVVPYDFLVLATGIQYNYFGHEDWRRTAPGLESLDDADLIRGKVLLAFERAEEIAALEHADTEKIRHLSERLGIARRVRRRRAGHFDCAPGIGGGIQRVPASQRTERERDDARFSNRGGGI
jgi:NADH dehydrogenase FAD-containing subunit